MPNIGVIRKGPVYPAFGLTNFNTYIAPLGEAINQGHDSFEHVSPYPLDQHREHFGRQLDERINTHTTRNIPVFDNLSFQNGDNPAAQFMMNSHYQLEHLMRTSPQMFADVKPNDRIFLQTGVIPDGWDNNPHMNKVFNTREGTLDHRTGRNIPERNHGLVRKPRDIGLVYHRGEDGKFFPVTSAPTAMWLPKKTRARTKFLTARPIGTQENSLQSHHEQEIYDRHRRHNKQNNFTGMPLPIQAQVLRHSHKKPEIRKSVAVLKERKSPEALRRKKEYDTKYESSPERVKYREDLNRERQRRGMYGDHSHRDISHTEGGKLTVEDEHKNRARHFKDKGTLRPITKGIKEDLELLRNLMTGPMDEQDKSIAQALLTSLDDYHKEEDVENKKELMHPYPF